MKIVTDNRVINAILRRVAKMNNCKGELYASHFHYIERTNTDDHHNFSNLVYKGKKYASKYFDGCFCPFVVEYDDPRELNVEMCVFRPY